MSSSSFHVSCSELHVFLTSSQDLLPKQSVAVGVLTVLYQSVLARLLSPFVAWPVPSHFLCAGCGNGEGHVAPVYAKWSPALVFTVKQYYFCAFSLKVLSGVLAASGRPLVPPLPVMCRRCPPSKKVFDLRFLIKKT